MPSVLSSVTVVVGIFALGCSGGTGSPSMTSDGTLANGMTAGAAGSGSQTAANSANDDSATSSATTSTPTADPSPMDTPSTAPSTDEPDETDETQTEPMTSPNEGPDDLHPTIEEHQAAMDLGDSVHPDAPFCPGLESAAMLALCTSDGECGDGGTCLFENAPTTCNLGCAGPMDQCSDAEPCPDGLLCVGTPAAEIRTSCACGGGTQCVSPCLNDEECGVGNECDADGRCQPVSCEDGYTCPAAATCDPSADAANTHGCRPLRCDEPEFPGCAVNQVCDPETLGGNGCVRKSCSTGADCDCGACSPHGAECVSLPGRCGTLATPG